MSEKQKTLLQLLKMARGSEENNITTDQIVWAISEFESSEKLPKRASQFFSDARRNKVEVSLKSKRHEERLAKILYLIEELVLQDGTKLRLIDYQVPLKRVRGDKDIGKIDLVGIHKNSLALVELKRADSTENPRRALLEILTYAVIVENPENFGKINAEILEKELNPQRCKGVSRIILAPKAYWDRWMIGKGRLPRGKEFHALCQALREGPRKLEVQCLSFDDQMKTETIL